MHDCTTCRDYACAGLKGTQYGQCGECRVKELQQQLAEERAYGAALRDRLEFAWLTADTILARYQRLIGYVTEEERQLRALLVDMKVGDPEAPARGLRDED